MPKRIQRKRSKGWRMPEGTIYVGRPTIWGNPFTHPNSSIAVTEYTRLLQGGTQSFQCEPGGLQIAKNAHPDCLHWAYADFVRNNIYCLRGKILACWCPLDQPCHADVLLELANDAGTIGGTLETFKFHF